MDSFIGYNLDAPPSRALRGSESKSFAQKTIRERLPTILANVIDDVHMSICSLEATQQKKIDQGKAIVHELSQLRHNLQRNKPAKILDDDIEDIHLWRKAQQELDAEIDYTYETLPWLFSECLVYRQVHGIIQSQSDWKGYDPFRRQKETSFKSTLSGSVELATRLGPLMSSSSVDAALFFEMLQLALWGNRADLSLLNEISAQKNMHQLSDLSAEALASNNGNILADDTTKVWDYLQSVQGQRIDIVLDNS
ncbi:Hairy/enhancer-of-split with YRPW motif protein 2, partial [Massospora cicadina]